MPRCETAAGDHMGHAEEADLGAEVPGIVGDLQQRGGTGAEEQAVDEPLVLQSKRGQFTRQREHKVCGWMCLCSKPARSAACWQAVQSTLVVTGEVAVCHRFPRNSQSVGLRRSPRQ